MAYVNQTTAEDTAQTIEKYEEELNQIGEFDTEMKQDDSPPTQEEKKQQPDDPEFLEQKREMI